MLNDMQDKPKTIVVGLVAPIMLVIGTLVLLFGSPTIFTLILIFGAYLLSAMGLQQLRNSQSNGHQMIVGYKVPNRTVWCVINVLACLVDFIIYRVKNDEASSHIRAAVAIASTGLWIFILYFVTAGIFIYFEIDTHDQPPVPVQHTDGIDQ